MGDKGELGAIYLQTSARRGDSAPALGATAPSEDARRPERSRIRSGRCALPADAASCPGGRAARVPRPERAAFRGSRAGAGGRLSRRLAAGPPRARPLELRRAGSRPAPRIPRWRPRPPGEGRAAGTVALTRRPRPAGCGTPIPARGGFTARVRVARGRGGRCARMTSSPRPTAYIGAGSGRGSARARSNWEGAQGLRARESPGALWSSGPRRVRGARPAGPRVSSR